MSNLFTPAADWQRLPTAARQAKQLGALVTNLVFFTIVAVAAGLALDWWLALAVAVFGLGWTTWRIIRAGRWVRAFGYSEREEDLLITQGLLVKRLTAIPYGRMLSVEVGSGPLDRLWGLAKVSLITASSQSNAAIPGVLQSEAAGLRDRLITAGESQALPL